MEKYRLKSVVIIQTTFSCVCGVCLWFIIVGALPMVVLDGWSMGVIRWLGVVFGFVVLVSRRMFLVGGVL